MTYGTATYIGSMSTGENDDDLVDKFSDLGFAWFKFIFGVVYVAFGLFCLATFFRARAVFEIRARSVYLVTTLGLLLLVYQGLSVDLHVIVLFGAPNDYFSNNLVVFFVTFSIASCYICRVMRLAVGFSPNLRRCIPWLMSEKLLVTTSLTIGVLSLSIPIYYRFTITGEDADTRFRDEQSDHVWTCTLILQIIQCCLLPVVWMIDDLFHISRELIVIIVVGLFQSVFVKLNTEGVLGDQVERYINPPNLQLLATSILFGLSIIDPVRRLKFNPMARTSAAMARAASKSAARQARSTRAVSNASGHERMSRGDSNSSQFMWTYEKIAANPCMAEIFRTFANRALCQEAVWFLEEVGRYQKADYTIASPLGGGQVAAFEAITKRFIADGAPDEVNISFKEKKAILSMYNRPNDSFDSDNEDELSGAFDRAYAEIRFMIEANLLHKFTETHEFRKTANARPLEPRKGFFLLPC